MIIELRDHPAKQRNRITGGYEPLIPDMRSIWLNDVMIGYCSTVPNRPICLLGYMTDSERDAILEAVTGLGLKPSWVSCPPKQPTPPRSGPSIWIPADMGTDDDE